MSDDLGALLGPDTAPSTAGGDPAVWTVLGEAGTDPQGQLGVASTLFNRMQSGGESTPGAVAVNPANGYEAWQNPASRAATQKQYPPGSPAYTQAQQLLADLQAGKVKPLPYDSFYSPQAQSALGRPKPTWDDGTGTPIGGNLFFSGKASSAAASDDLGALLSATAPKATPPSGGDPAETAFNARFGSGPQAPTGGGDAANAVPGGFTISPNKAGAYVDAQGQPYAPAADVGNGYFRNKAGQLFQVASPPTEGATKMALAPAGGAQPPFPAGQSGFDRFGIGLDQGVRTVGTTADKFQNWLDQNVPGANWVDTHVSPLLGAPTAPNAVAQDIANRDANDIRYGSSPAYGLGKFGGEVGATLPLMALTGGAAEAAPVVGGGLAALRGAGLAGRAATGALQGAEAAGYTSGGSETPLSSQLFGGAATGGLLVPGGSLLNAGMRRFATSGADAVSPYIQDLAAKADNYGINLRGTQIAAAAERAQGITNGPMAIRDSELLKAPGSGYGASQQGQRTAWNAALAKTIGAPEGATSFSPEVMSAAKANNSAAFQRAGQNVSISDTDGLLSDLGSVARDASMVVPESELTPLTKQIQNIASTVSDGKLSGDSYLALTRTGSPLDRLASGDSAASWYGQQMRSVLDDYAQQSLTPEQQADFAQARLNWRNMKTIEPLVGASPGEYQISPLRLLSRVASNPYTKGDLVYNGGGELGDLARIGHIIGDKASDSGTASRLSDQIKAAAATTALGGEGLLAVTNPMLAAKLAAGAGAVAGARYGINAVRGARGMSPAFKSALLGGAQPEPATSGIMTPIANFVRPAVIPAAAIWRNQLTNPAPAYVPAQ